MASLNAPIRWAQRKDKVFLTIELRDIKNEKIDLNEKQLSFSADSDGKRYEQVINFFGDVDTQESKWIKNDLHLQFIIIKKEKTSAFWNRLIIEDIKNSNIQIDWSKYVDEDDEESEGSKGVSGGDWDPEMMNKFGGGMPGMGGMGMPGMGGMGMPGMGGMGMPGMGGMGMPGMGGMPGMEGLGDDDSDEEHDLEKEEGLPGQQAAHEENKCEDNCGHKH